MSLLKEGDGASFQKASVTLDGCVKIYTSRVDSINLDTSKLLSGLAESGNKKKRGADAEGSGDEDEEAEEGEDGQKKKKKRAKALKALSALRPGGKDEIPDELVDTVLQRVREEGGEIAHADAATVRLALEQMKIKRTQNDRQLPSPPTFPAI